MMCHRAYALENELVWLKRVKPHSFSWSTLEIHPGTALYERKGNRSSLLWTISPINGIPEGEKELAEETLCPIPS